LSLLNIIKKVKNKFNRNDKCNESYTIKVKDIKGDIIISFMYNSIKTIEDIFPINNANSLKKLLEKSSNKKFKKYLKNSRIKILKIKKGKNSKLINIRIESFGVNGIARYTILIQKIN
jgi:hypothetical protein